MAIEVGNLVLYSITLDGDRTGSNFTSFGKITDLSPTHVSLSIPEDSDFPYHSDDLPKEYQTPQHDSKAKRVTDIKIPRLFVRKVQTKGKQPSKDVMKGVTTQNCQSYCTMWPDEEHDYVFWTVCFDFRGLGPYDTPRRIVISDTPIKTSITFEDEVKVEPLDPKDPANFLVLKQQPNALYLSSLNYKYVVPTSCTKWTNKEMRDYIASEIRKDLREIDAFHFTLIKAVRKSEFGYYAFTESDRYIDTRSFLGTVYIDHKTGQFNVASFDEDMRDKEGSDPFFHPPYFKVGYSVFISREAPVSESKTMTGFYNMSLSINNLLLLLGHGKDHPLFGGKTDRIVQLMDNPDCPGDYVQKLARFWLDPSSLKPEFASFRRKYLWWL